MPSPAAGIYEIRNTVNGHRYIGQSNDIADRLMHHRRSLVLGKHCNAYLQRAWDKHGEAAFEFSILAALDPPVTKQELTDFEQDYVDFFKPEYNIRRECVTSPLGVKASAETRAKLSASHKGKPGHKWTAEQKERMATLFRGKPLSPEHIAKLSISRKGRKVWNKGVQAPPELRAKLSAAHKGKPWSPAQCRAGNTRSAQTRARVSAALMGKPWSEARRLAEQKRRERKDVTNA